MAVCCCGRHSPCGVGCPNFPYDKYHREEEQERQQHENTRLLREIRDLLKNQSPPPSKEVDRS